MNTNKPTDEISIFCRIVCVRMHINVCASLYFFMKPLGVEGGGMNRKQQKKTKKQTRGSFVPEPPVFLPVYNTIYLFISIFMFVLLVCSPECAYVHM